MFKEDKEIDEDSKLRFIKVEIGMKKLKTQGFKKIINWDN